MSKEKPILFNTEMVKAIMSGKKIMTRRIVKHQPPENSIIHGRVMSSTEPKNEGCVGWGPNEECVNHYSKIPYEIGQVLWVRETWAQLDMDYRAVSGKLDIQEFKGCPIAYKADNDAPEHFNYWRPSIHMPRTAARLFLKVTNIRVERLQDITQEDIESEGLWFYSQEYRDEICKWRDCVSAIRGTRKKYFKKLWNSINSKRGYGWDVNPWVWVVEFERIEGGK